MESSATDKILAYLNHRYRGHHLMFLTNVRCVIYKILRVVSEGEFIIFYLHRESSLVSKWEQPNKITRQVQNYFGRKTGYHVHSS
jgi:hypothetical protein